MVSNESGEFLAVLPDCVVRFIEHTDKERYWGDGGDGSGQNHLGRILEQVRTELTKVSSTPSTRL
jgi:predicted NAD-dependent protein-ADP-ribosyltransferase YbiA (DUF1768 family)